MFGSRAAWTVQCCAFIVVVSLATGRYNALYDSSAWHDSKFVAADGAAGDFFGDAVSVSGDGSTVIAGAYHDDDNGSNAGSAYIFAYNGTAWTQRAKLVASDGAAGDEFGCSVSISSDGTTVLIGAQNVDTAGGSGSGSAYVFVANGAAWTQTAKLIASDGATGDAFGNAVSISSDGKTALIGAYGDDDKGFTSGSAYVFARNDSGWVESAKLVASDGATDDRFGWSVSVNANGTYALIGAIFDNSAQGSAYAFHFNGASWVEQAKIVSWDGAASDEFGKTVSVSGDGTTAIVGADGDDDDGSNSGSAYIFLYNGTAWTQRAKLSASDGAAEDKFGNAVAISMDGVTVIVGTSGDDDRGSFSGSVYVFADNGTAWTQTAKLAPSDGAAGDAFGNAVSISGDGRTVVVGSDGDDEKGNESGSVYVWSNPPASQRASDTASSNPGATVGAAVASTVALVAFLLYIKRRKSAILCARDKRQSSCQSAKDEGGFRVHAELSPITAGDRHSASSGAAVPSPSSSDPTFTTAAQPSPTGSNSDKQLIIRLKAQFPEWSEYVEREPKSFARKLSNLRNAHADLYLGGGALSRVYRVPRTVIRFADIPEDVVVIKVTGDLFSSCDADSFASFVREARALAHADQQRKYHGISRAPFPLLHRIYVSARHNRAVFVLENGRQSIEDDLGVNGKYTAEKLNWLIAEVSFGLCWMWREGMFHRDIKTGNLIVRDDGTSIMIADLGSASMRSRAMSTVVGGTAGTDAFSAPEVFDEHGDITDAERYSVMSDVYSFGLVLVRALCGDMDEFRRVATSLRADTAERMNALARVMNACDSLSEDIQNLIRRCLAYHPHERTRPQELWDAMHATLGTSWHKESPAYRIMLYSELRRPELGSAFAAMPQWWRLIEHRSGELHLIPLCSNARDGVRHSAREFKPFVLPTNTRAKVSMAVAYFGKFVLFGMSDLAARVSPALASAMDGAAGKLGPAYSYSTFSDARPSGERLHARGTGAQSAGQRESGHEDAVQDKERIDHWTRLLDFVREEDDHRERRQRLGRSFARNARGTVCVKCAQQTRSDDAADRIAVDS